ncbi:MAG: 16S rRNA (cytosine(967)-C(5))-methyltransferase RsmB [Candidatus Acidiferrales bacterium]|jgi:16S rRNA (cytosine967-C5)-methyltransferase
MPVSVARRIAFQVLRRVEAEGAYASDLLHAELGASVKPADAALATELTLGVLRQRRLLDFLLERQLKKSVDQLDLPVALALRIGAYQLRFLGKIPPRAAVNESVELVKSARKSSAAPLVNAVLRRIAEQAKAPAENLLPPNLPLAERLAILHSHPAWMVERWLSRLGDARTIALLEADNRPSRLSCALNDADRRGEILRALEKAGLRVEPGRLLKNAFAVSGGSPSQTEAFRAGQISIQDEASQAVPFLLGVHPGDRVLDLCAAPGGKTPALARAAGNAGIVIAADRHAHRLRAMAAQFKRLGLAGVRLVELDATQPLPFARGFDRIFLDAPCSGTGTLARHPEIRWRLRPEQLAEFHDLQVRMLGGALAHLAPGGRLVYSTCSIEPEENEHVVSEVLRAARSVQRAPAEEMAQALAPHLAPGVFASALFDPGGEFRTLPGQSDTDGFFAAALQSS